MMKSLRAGPAALLVVLGLLAFARPAAAQSGVRIQLVSEVTAIVPGQPFYLGLFIRHEPGYHTYWRQPGIVGVPTQMQWTLPPGFEAGELEYPEAERVLMYRIKAQGYERNVLLQTRITPPQVLEPGKNITLSGKAIWMACSHVCEPGMAELHIELPVAATNAPNPRWQPLFLEERSSYAQTSNAWEASATESGLEVTVLLKPKSAEARQFGSADEAQRLIFFTEDGWINSDEPQRIVLNADGSVTIKLVRADIFLGKTVPTHLNGQVQRPDGWVHEKSWRTLTITPPLQRPAGRERRS